jgi:hypothetical protein
MALDQERYVVSVDASWKRSGFRKKARMAFSGSGVDDRHDFLRWFNADDVRVGSSIEVTVVDTRIAHPPTRAPRVTVERVKRRLAGAVPDSPTIAVMKARLRALRAGTASPVVLLPNRPSTVGFRVTLNGRHLVRVGVGDPGTLTVSIYVRLAPDGRGASLHIHGGDRVSDGYRWRTWTDNDVGLNVGDRVRITFVAPKRLDRGQIRAIDDSLPTTVAEIQSFLRHLRHSATAQARRASLARYIRYERDRPAPRAYPRRLLVEAAPAHRSKSG